MILKAKFSLVALFILATTFGQERIWTKQTKLSEVITFEREVDPKPNILSQSVSLSKEYYPLAETYQTVNPLIIQRKQLGFLPVYAEYFYTPNDSIIRLISYDWERDKYGNFFDKQKIWKEESKKFKDYNKEYERIKEILSTQLGIPTSTDTKAKEVESERGKYFTRETLWENSDFHAELYMIFESMTYRIRLTMYWKK